MCTTRIKAEVATFAVGAGLIATGLSPVPFGEGFLIAGSSLASMGYSVVLLKWRGKGVQRTALPGGIPPSPSYDPPSPSAAAPALSPPIAQTQAPPTSPPVQPSPSRIAPPAPPAATLPSTPPQPVSEKIEIPHRKIPSFKTPKISLPRPIVEHRIPISLIVIGVPLIVAGLITAGLSPSVAIGYGLLIPGIFLFGVGGLILFLQLYRRPVGLRRFCMHCGFQMTTLDAACARCHKQPMSGIDTRICPNCNTVNPALAKYCKDCGAGQPSPTMSIPT